MYFHKSDTNFCCEKQISTAEKILFLTILLIKGFEICEPIFEISMPKFPVKKQVV